ncbi:MAG: ATP-binding protein [Acidimicrobiales bacterium]
MAATKAAVRGWLPQGNTLDVEAFAERHLLLRALLALHVPALAAFAVLQGVTPLGAAAAVVLPVVCVFAASVFRDRRVQAVFTTVGFLWCSAALVHLSGGMVEAHFHFFIVVGLVALYQDWPPFLFAIGFSVVSNGVAGLVDPASVYNHPSGQANPLLWALIEGGALVAASATQVLFWRATERSQAKAAGLASDLVLSEQQSAQRASVSELFVNLARRNQSLLDRQLALIDDLEQGERDPDALAELFKLDHLATRIRRNAESLLVLSGEEPSRRWGAPVALAEVARAAVAEVEDFTRANIAVDDDVAVSGRAVADLAHLLAELIENATAFSPPTTPVQVRGRRARDGRCLMTVEDRGIGMSLPELAAVNERLASPPEADVDLDRRLGFRVVSRLAARYGVRVALAETPGGGVTAVIEIPAELVAAPGGSLVGAITSVAAAPAPAASTPDTSPVAPASVAPAPMAPAPAAAEPLAPVLPVRQPAAPASPPPASVPAPVLEPVAAPEALPTRQPATVFPPVQHVAAAAEPVVAAEPMPTRQPAPPVAMPEDDPATAEPAAVLPALPTRVPGAAAPVPSARPSPARTAPAPPPPPSGAPAATPPVAPAGGGVTLPKRTPAATTWPAPPRPNVTGGLPFRPPVTPPGPADGAKPAAARTPEQARLLLSRFQSGQTAGRSAADARRDNLAVSASTVDLTTPEEER